MLELEWRVSNDRTYRAPFVEKGDGLHALPRKPAAPVTKHLPRIYHRPLRYTVTPRSASRFGSALGSEDQIRQRARQLQRPGACVLPDGMSGNTDASTTRRPLDAVHAQLVVHDRLGDRLTGPIFAVPTGWYVLIPSFAQKSRISSSVCTEGPGIELLGRVRRQRALPRRSSAGA